MPDRAATAQGVLSPQQVREFSPNLIYVEGGLFVDGRDTWKIPWSLAEALVEAGGVLIAADCGTHEIGRRKAQYNHAARFLRARPKIPAEAFAPGDGGCADRLERDREFVCQAGRMVVSPWLRPTLTGVSQVGVRNPAMLACWDGIAASRSLQRSTSGQECNCEQNVEEEPWVFASAGQCGRGFVVFIAGEVSAEDWIGRFPSNVVWLTNLADLLVKEAERNKLRAVYSASLPFKLFLSHRSVNKQLAVRVGEALRSLGAHVSLDKANPVPAASLIQEISRGLEKMTHFVLFWSRACLGAPWVERELGTAIKMAVEMRIPVIVVRLDMTPAPKVIGDSFRIEGMGMSPQELAESLMQGVRRLGRNAG